MPLLSALAGTLVPLALFSVGMQIRLSEWRADARLLAIGLGYKLVLAPALLFGIVFLFGVRGLTAQVSVFEASMAPMITSAILAGEYHLNPKLANLMVSIGIIVSFATSALWWLAVQLL